MLDYKTYTLNKIKELCTEFNTWDNEDIEDFYSYWSEKTYCAGWIDGGEKKFVEYALTRPIDARRKYYDEY